MADAADERTMPARYRFGPLHRPGLVAGFRGGQLGAVAAGLLTAVGILRVAPDALGMAGAAAVVAIGVGAASWPLGGRTAEEWVPDAVRFAVGQARRPRGPAAVFSWFRLLTVELDGAGVVGVVADRRRGVHSAVVAMQAPGFVLLGPADKDRRVADWAAVLASLARDGSSVHRLQWLERTVPDDGAAHRDDLARRRRLPAGSPADISYRQLLDQVGRGSVRHSVLLVVSVRAPRRAPRADGGSDGAACRVLLREVAMVRRRLHDADIASSAPLGPAALADVVTSAVSPSRTVASGTATSGSSLPGGPAPAAGEVRSSIDAVTAWWPWPMGMAEDWGRLRTDGTWHATYWVAQWPRTDVPADFLASLLLVGDVRRTVSVVMEPVGPTEAARQVEHDRTAELADSELRRRGGFLATARRQRQAATLAGREAELADGHASFRFSAYVTVTSDDADTLADACERVEQAAVQAGLELRRCYGDQLRAFVATLPLAAGLP